MAMNITAIMAGDFFFSMVDLESREGLSFFFLFL